MDENQGKAMPPVTQQPVATIAIAWWNRIGQAGVGWNSRKQLFIDYRVSAPILSLLNSSFPMLQRRFRKSKDTNPLLHHKSCLGLSTRSQKNFIFPLFHLKAVFWFYRYFCFPLKYVKHIKYTFSKEWECKHARKLK